MTPRQSMRAWRVAILGALQLVAYPRLRELPIPQRDSALRRARTTELDTIERAGIVASVVAASMLLQSIGEGTVSPIGRYLLQFVVALPLLAALIGPFLVRRTRRGLDIECVSMRGGEECLQEKSRGPQQQAFTRDRY